MVRLTLLVIFLFVPSCGKNNRTKGLSTTAGPSGSSSSSENVDSRGNDSSHYAPGPWGINLRGRFFSANPRDEAEAGNRNFDAAMRLKGRHRIIKDKVIYRYVHGDGLEGSFLFGDDYRFSINSTFEEMIKLRDMIRVDHGGENRIETSTKEMWVNFEVYYPEDIPVRDMYLSFLRYDNLNQSSHSGFEDIPSNEVLLKKVERWEGNPVIFDFELTDLQTLPVRLSVPAREIITNRLDGPDRNPLHVVEISDFRQGDTFFGDHLKDLYDNYARVYLNTSVGEDVFYVSPGVKIVDFLEEQFETVVLTDNGSIMQLGEDIADISSLAEMRDIEQQLWIQYPGGITENDTFLANKPYLFIHGAGREILSHASLVPVNDDREVFKDKLEIRDMRRDSVYFARLRLVEIEHYLVNSKKKVTYNYWVQGGGRCSFASGNRSGGLGRFCEDAWHDREVDADYRSVEIGRRREIRLNNDRPQVVNGSLETLYTYGSGESILVALRPDPGTNKIELRNVKPRKDWRDVRTGFIRCRDCRDHNIIRGDTEHETRKIGKEYEYKIWLHRFTPGNIRR